MQPADRPLRVVIDTNHIMSALLSDRGASAKLIDWMTKEDDYFRLLLSKPIWDEYNTVADWLIPESRQVEKQRILEILRLQSEWIEPLFQLQVCSDQSDNRFLECAVAGQGDYLVTKSIRHFPHKEYNGIKIVRVRVFLDVLEQMTASKESRL
jgi:putative PIN family toxin of toxin-antitoxin system